MPEPSPFVQNYIARRRELEAIRQFNEQQALRKQQLELSGQMAQESRRATLEDEAFRRRQFEQNKALSDRAAAQAGFGLQAQGLASPATQTTEIPASPAQVQTGPGLVGAADPFAEAGIQTIPAQPQQSFSVTTPGGTPPDVFGGESLVPTDPFERAQRTAEQQLQNKLSEVEALNEYHQSQAMELLDDPSISDDIKQKVKVFSKSGLRLPEENLYGALVDAAKDIYLNPNLTDEQRAARQKYAEFLKNTVAMRAMTQSPSVAFDLAGKRAATSYIKQAQEFLKKQNDTETDPLDFAIHVAQNDPFAPETVVVALQELKQAKLSGTSEEPNYEQKVKSELFKPLYESLRKNSKSK